MKGLDTSRNMSTTENIFEIVQNADEVIHLDQIEEEEDKENVS